MDSLTQIILGAAVAEAVAGKELKGKAAFWGAIGGTLPDLDVFLRFFYDPLNAALVHRGFSHSLLFACLAGPVLGWCFHHLTKKRYRLRMWVLLWFLAIVTHPMLDMFTNYGTQFLWPFSPRIAFNTVFVIDPLYTVPFMVALIGALCIRKNLKRRRRWNNFGLIYSSSYLLFGVIVKLIILNSASSYMEKSGFHASKVMVTPMPLTSFYWTIIAEGDSSYCIGYTSIFSDFDPKRTEVFPKNHELLREIDWKGDNRIDQIEHITNGFYSVYRSNDSILVSDLRFGTTTPLTAGKFRSPIMNYGILLHNNQVDHYYSANSRDFGAIDFGNYMNQVFGK